MFKKIIFAAIFLCLPFSTTLHAKSKKIGADCTYKGKKLYGKIQFVKNFGDIRVEIVDNFGDLKVEVVKYYATSCGKWEIVSQFPDLKVEIVKNFGDIKIEFVKYFPVNR